FMTQRRKRSKRGRTWGQQLAIKENRRRIETTFSEITARFTKKIHAVTFKGFQLKVFLAVFAYTIFRFLNL
ncbi:MAG: IS982 family transposase, partial [Thermonemataceae bacterium]